MKVYYLLVLCFWGTIPSVHSQFFYSHYTPVTSPEVFHQTLPFLTYNNLVPALPPQPIQYNSHSHSLSPSPSPPLSSYQQPQFRGFGYRTDLQNGASSTVFYVTGAESEQFKNFQDFPKLSRFFEKTKTTSAGKARNLASDMVDSTIIPNPETKIQTILNQKSFQQLFDNAMKGVVNFYSYPANTAPLVAFTNYSGNDTENVVGAESVVNPQVLINQIANIIKENETTESNTPVNDTNVTTSTTTATVQLISTSQNPQQTLNETKHDEINKPTTTEDPESIAIEARDAAITTTETESETTTTEIFRIIME